MDYNEKYNGLIESVNLTKDLVNELREKLKYYDQELELSMINIQENLDNLVNDHENEKNRLNRLEENITDLQNIITNMRLNQLPKVLIPKTEEKKK